MARVQRRRIADDVTQLAHPRRRAAVMIECAVRDLLGVRIDRAEDAWEDLIGEFADSKFAPEAAWAKIALRQFTQRFGGDAEGCGHLHLTDRQFGSDRG